MRQFVRKILQTLVAFVLFILVGLILIALSTNFTFKLEQKSFGHMTHWGSSFARIDEFENWAGQKPTKARGLIIGSSTAYRNINPHILQDRSHIDWFNYGSSGQPPKISYFLLQDAFKKTKLDYVLLDITHLPPETIMKRLPGIREIAIEFAGVDPIAVIEIQRIVRFLKSRGIGVLITDHNVRETLGICDRAYIISEGKVLTSGVPDAIINDASVRRVYLGEHFKM